MKCVMGNTGNIVFSALALFLTGRASSHLHNGVQTNEDSQGAVFYFISFDFVRIQ